MDILTSDNYPEIRKAIESKKISALKTNFSLNQVLCKLMHDNGIKLIIDLDNIGEDKKKRALALKKIMHNLKLCKKYKVEVVVKAEKMDDFEIKTIKKVLN